MTEIRECEEAARGFQISRAEKPKPRDPNNVLCRGIADDKRMSIKTSWADAVARSQ